MKIQDAFEIKEEYRTGHEPGLVLVLDTLIVEDPNDLVGRIATIRIPSGGVLKLPIDEAKQHGPVNSLFFRRLVLHDILVGCEIAIAQAPPRESTERSPSIAS